ncbi:MAG: hypothetical protein NC900_03155 [Candidatus Omnitrophica bacterium]|nr:hypothetical protein [Candidatus Omnitrophota bacterium]
MKKIIILLMIGFIFLSCAGLKEAIKGFLGISTKILEEKRAEAKVLVLSYDYFTTYHKVLDKLKESGSFVYKKTSDLIAFYLSEEDTTPVGIFFQELEKEKTKLEISSDSSSAKERIFNILSTLK